MRAIILGCFTEVESKHIEIFDQRYGPSNWEIKHLDEVDLIGFSQKIYTFIKDHLEDDCIFLIINHEKDLLKILRFFLEEETTNKVERLIDDEIQAVA